MFIGKGPIFYRVYYLNFVPRHSVIVKSKNIRMCDWICISKTNNVLLAWFRLFNIPNMKRWRVINSVTVLENLLLKLNFLCYLKFNWASLKTKSVDFLKKTESCWWNGFCVVTLSILTEEFNIQYVSIATHTQTWCSFNSAIFTVSAIWCLALIICNSNILRLDEVLLVSR